MYNRIPGERASKQGLFVALLVCITLMSVLAAGYFAWLAKSMQTGVLSDRDADLPSDDIAAVIAADQQPAETVLDVVPEFTYPAIVQPALRVQAPENGGSRLLAMLDDWQEVNTGTGVCVQVREYLADVSYPASYTLSASEMLEMSSIRSALTSYFAVSSADEQKFFDGITAALDADDMFAQDATMCASSNGARKFLLLDDVRVVTLDSGRTSSQSFPEILEWHEPSTGGFVWTDYVGEYRVMDGYRFYPDWYGNVLVQTGYGDAGYSHWEVQQLEASGGVPVITTLEKCFSEPTADYLDSVVTCEVTYTE